MTIYYFSCYTYIDMVMIIYVLFYVYYSIDVFIVIYYFSTGTSMRKAKAYDLQSVTKSLSLPVAANLMTMSVQRILKTEGIFILHYVLL